MNRDLNSLTPKQRDALDLLIQHKTSKQISRELGISPFTVDQRLNAAREKFGLATRIELAQHYRALAGDAPGSTVVVAPTVIAPPVLSAGKSPAAAGSDTVLPEATVIARESGAGPHVAGISQSLVYRPLGMALAGAAGQFRFGEGGAWVPAGGGLHSGTGDPGSTYPGDAPAEYYHVLPEMFDGPYGTVLRLGAMLLTTLALMILALAAMAIYSQLGALLDH